MKRLHRIWHRWVWLTLTPLLAVLLALAWCGRTAPPAELDLPLPLADVTAHSGG